ncbi:DUF961 family protein [Enterococcus faecalis]|uniref:DUF961 family protein n=1 Tax=Enterococcus TaxID=1350 RepID=UPI0015716E5B|nr:DUF961 family protein [Enterococcus faecalis]NSN29387.1 DUF961 family protein [Enterococcus faecalis]
MKEKPITFDENKIPVLFNQSVGKVTFIAVRENKYERDSEGNLTDVVRSKSIEVSSEIQRETFNVDLPADFDLSPFKFGDVVEIEGVDVVEPWSQLPAGERSVNSVYTGFSAVATGIRKVTLNNSQSTQNEPQKSFEKGEKGKDK